VKKNRIRRVPLAVGFAVAVQVLSAVLSGVVFGFNVVSNTAGSSGIIVGLTLPLGFVFWVAAPIALSIGALAGYGWTRWALLAFNILTAALSLGAPDAWQLPQMLVTLAAVGLFFVPSARTFFHRSAPHYTAADSPGA
jgi:hypothetical protein